MLGSHGIESHVHLFLQVDFDAGTAQRQKLHHSALPDTLSQRNCTCSELEVCHAHLEVH